MHSRQRHLAFLNGVGGAAVLGSYALAFSLSPEIREGLWGGVPLAWRGLYTLCMLLAAAGYFPFTYQWVFRTDPDRYRGIGGIGYGAVIAQYAAILVGSAIWLPLTAWLLHDFALPLWWATRAVLAVVGLASTLNLALCGARALERGGVLAWLSALGAVPFWFQTAILDAVVWPACFSDTL